MFSICFVLPRSENRSFIYVARSLFTINEFVILVLHLCFQFKIMYVKNILLQISFHVQTLLVNEKILSTN